MVRRPGRAERQRFQEEKLNRMKERYPPEKSATAGLWSLHDAYTREVKQKCAPDRSNTASRLVDDDDEESVSRCAHRNSALLMEYKVFTEAVQNIQLAGAVMIDGSHTVAAAGIGRGVPPSARIELCAIIAPGKGRPAVVVTAADDGMNLLWVPTSDWQQLGFVPFVSVASRYAGETCSTNAIRKVVKREVMCKDHGRECIDKFLFSSLGRPACPSTAPVFTRKVKEDEASKKRALMREREAKDTQYSHLDANREETMSKIMFTTVVRHVDFDIMRRACDVLDDQRLQCVPDGIDTGSGVPNTPRGVLELVRKRQQDSLSTASPSPRSRLAGMPVARQVDSDKRPAAFSTVASARARLPPASIQAASIPRRSLQVSCIEAHPELDLVVAGIGNGQISVYQLYRAHGERQPQLHQTQVFDASRRQGDLVTALHMPAEPLAQEGALGEESYIAGFESGRVAVFQVLERSDVQSGPEETARGDASEDPSLLDLVMRRGTQEPVFLAREPLLLDLNGKREFGPVVRILWYPAHGILSMSAQGMVIAADIRGTENWRIPFAGGINASVSSMDLSVRMDQLAVAGERGEIRLWQCLTQTHAGTLDPSEASRSPVLLVQYLPSDLILASAHEADGLVLVWDVVRLELQQTLQTPDCLRASCAVWDQRQSMILVFGPKGVVQRRLVEEPAEAADLFMSSNKLLDWSDRRASRGGWMNRILHVESES